MRPQPENKPLKGKSTLHPRNRHRVPYDFNILIEAIPELSSYVRLNPYNVMSLDYANPKAVLLLNKALLKCFYNMEDWSFPSSFLCPPIPGRVDYVHYIADLLGSKNRGKVPKGSKVNCLDIGVGANCIYPILGVNEYGWSFTGADIDLTSIESAQQIVDENACLKGKVALRLQKNSCHVFRGIIQKQDFFDVTICNPPFHASPEEVLSASRRKTRNLTKKKVNMPIKNFGGQSSELWCEGGEIAFIESLIRESNEFYASSFWYTTLVSKEASLKAIYSCLKKVDAFEVRTIPMSQGNKVSRIVAWTFLTPALQKIWVERKW